MAEMGITRDQAFALLEEHLKNENLKRHCLATEAIMIALARRFGQDETLWGVTGLLHDLDLDIVGPDMNAHGLKTAEILRAKGVSEEIVKTILSHNEAVAPPRSSVFEHALAAAETITGLIVATALVYPDKKVASEKPSSVVKRMKEKGFARSASRENIMECEKIGLTLPEFVEVSLGAMKEIADQIGL